MGSSHLHPHQLPQASNHAINSTKSLQSIFNCVTTNIEILQNLSASRHWWVLSERFWPQVTAEIGSESTKSIPSPSLFLGPPPTESQDSRCTVYCIYSNVFNLPKINGQWIWWWFWRCYPTLCHFKMLLNACSSLWNPPFGLGWSPCAKSCRPSVFSFTYQTFIVGHASHLLSHDCKSRSCWHAL